MPDSDVLTMSWEPPLSLRSARGALSVTGPELEELPPPSAVVSSCFGVSAVGSVGNSWFSMFGARAAVGSDAAGMRGAVGVRPALGVALPTLASTSPHLHSPGNSVCDA